MADRFGACELARCRASLMLRWHTSAVLVVRFVASAPPASDQPAAPLTMRLEVYDAGGRRVGDPRVIPLSPSPSESPRLVLHRALADFALPTPSVAPLLVTCDVRAARVFLDDAPLGVVPLAVTQVTPGRHRLHVSAPGHRPHAQVFEVPVGGARVDVRLEPESTP